MKEIIIKIPTHYQKDDKRLMYNKSVLMEFAKSVHGIANSDY